MILHYLHFLKSNHLLLLVLFSSVIQAGKAQNARFSQPWNAPLMLNPALSGNFNGMLRFGGTSSWQSSDISTVGHQYVYLDGKVTQPYVNNHWGFGGSVYNYGEDYFRFTKTTSPIHAQFYAANIAYHISLTPSTKRHWLSYGIQVAAATADLDEERGLYDKEISGGGFRFDNLEQRKRTGYSNYKDINLGAMYALRMENLNVEMGVSLYHIFAPKNNLVNIDINYRQRRRGVLFANVAMQFGKSNLILRNIFWQEGLYYNSRSLDAQLIVHQSSGIEFQRKVPTKKFYVDGGLYTRGFKTLMPYASFNWGPALSFRTSYEFPSILRKTESINYTAKRFEFGITMMFRQKTKQSLSKDGNTVKREVNFW